jgi:hypothetical protein
MRWFGLAYIVVALGWGAAMTQNDSRPDAFWHGFIQGSILFGLVCFPYLVVRGFFGAVRTMERVWRGED